MTDQTQESTTTFEHVGPRIAFGDVLISNEEAETFRLSASKGVKIKELFIGDAQSRIQMTSYADGILSDAAADYDVYSMAYFSKTLLGQEPDFWRSSITFARYNAKNRDTKIYNIYEVESYQGEVVLGVRRVRIIRNLARLAFNENGDPYEDIYSRQRKAYEVPITSEDIVTIDRLVERTTSRSRVTGGH